MGFWRVVVNPLPYPGGGELALAPLNMPQGRGGRSMVTDTGLNQLQVIARNVLLLEV